MQWSADRNAGFSRANPQKLYLRVIIDPSHHYEQVNVEQQQSSRWSLLWWMKRLIALRKRYRAFGRGTVEFLQPEDRKVLAFIRRYENEIVLVVANLSRLVQCFELDLARSKAWFPSSCRAGRSSRGRRPAVLPQPRTVSRSIGSRSSRPARRRRRG